MKTLSEHLIQYSAYHRVTQNIQTHFIGIPLILLAVFSLLSFSFFEQPWLTPAVWLWTASTIFYWRLDRRFGIAMGIVLAVCAGLGLQLAQLPTAIWLGGSVGLFSVGWLLQFIGHYFEGRKPAFVDDVMGLAIGPLFVVAELAFKLGLRPELAAQIVAATGPERARR